jgi:hypothetical protein
VVSGRAGGLREVGHAVEVEPVCHERDEQDAAAPQEVERDDRVRGVFRVARAEIAVPELADHLEGGRIPREHAPVGAARVQDAGVRREEEAVYVRLVTV